MTVMDGRIRDRSGERGRTGGSVLWGAALTAAFLALGFSSRSAVHRRDLGDDEDTRASAAEVSGAHRVIARSRAGQRGRGREAAAPGDIPARGWKDILRRTWTEVGEDRLVMVAAGVTFYGLLALFPALAALVSIYGLFADPATIGDHMSTLSNVLPGEGLDIIRQQLASIASADQQALGVGFVIGLAVSLWLANQAMKAIFDALNVVYEEDEKRGFIKLNAITLFFTLCAILLIVLTIGLIVVLPVAINFIGLGGSGDWIITLARWPILLLIVAFALSVLYRFGPSRDKARWRWITWGSAGATIMWFIVSLLFSWYVSNWGNYNETYGSLGAVIALMTWMWLSTLTILIGAELNAEIEHQTARDTTAGPRAPLGSRGARMADTVGAART